MIKKKTANRKKNSHSARAKPKYRFAVQDSHSIAGEGDRAQSLEKRRPPTVASNRRYGLLTVQQAREVATQWLANVGFQELVTFGLPEIDDRYHVWRVPLVKLLSKERVGEVVIDARTSIIRADQTTSKEVLQGRLLGVSHKELNGGDAPRTIISAIRNAVIQGDCETALQDLPADSVGLIFTSPPYYNARPEYEDYLSYEDYLLKMRKVIHQSHRVLVEGRFFVLNVSPVLIRRNSRNESSRRLAVPFDFHNLFMQEGFDFIDDIIWQKPSGAGWATGRGRRFAADRTPLQYKPVPVTEYVLVYRKHTDKLIDWNIRSHPDQGAVHRSKIRDDYERTNVWKISPAHSKIHPAVFPLELAERVISYYSFEGDAVLDPFAGVGTTGRAAICLRRRFVLIENKATYVNHIRHHIVEWMGSSAKEVLWVHCEEPDSSELVLF